MRDRTGSPLTRVSISWGSWWRLAMVVLTAVLAIRLWQTVLVVLVAALLAVALDPVVDWIERRGLSRGVAIVVLLCACTLSVVALLLIGWSSLAAQSALLVGRAADAWRDLTTRFPWLAGVGSGSGDRSAITGAGVRLVSSLAHAVIVCVLALILTAYLLADGRRTWAWLRAFVPERHHARLDATAADVRCEVRAYAAGNLATSIFAAAFVLVALSALRVPAALVLALLAGLCDFVPVLGFVLSAAPAVLLALSVSSTTALAVIALYGAYHLLENYLIAPRVYGNQLRLSDVAVLVAFAIGAQLAGVIGALIALPVAAAYPAVERTWLRPYLAGGAVEDHARIEDSGGA